MKKTFYTEMAYLFGTVLMAFATALIEAGDFGVSMIVAPAYLLHLKLSPVLPFFSFGVAEIVFQVLLLVLMSLLVRRFKFSYLFSFVTTAIYGVLLDGFMALIDLVDVSTLTARIAVFSVGFILCGLAVALFFRTYISGEAYELFVMEVSRRYNKNIHRFKTFYDCASLTLAIVMSLVFFGFGQGNAIGIGTIVTAVLNGTIIKLWSGLLDKKFIFIDRCNWRRYFEK